MYRSSMLRSVTSVFTLVFLVFCFIMPVFAQFESSAGSAILMEASTGKVLYEKNADISVPPASITKVMTLLVAFEAIESGKVTWEDLVPVSEAAWKMGGSKMFLEVGRKVKLGDIITGISVVSANDGCIAIAEYLYGSENAFVQVMNTRAKELGLTKTNFRNCTGLPAEGHAMSAKDIAVLARYLIERFPRILEIESIREFTFNGIIQYNRNPLLGTFQGADGLKTGWTEEAGYCLVGTARQNDMRLISVVLNTPNEKERLIASQELLTYGFKNFQLVKVKKAGEVVGNVEVKNASKQLVPVKINTDVVLIVPVVNKDSLKDVKLEIVNGPQMLKAPMAAGTAAGKVEGKLNGETLFSADVFTAEDVSKANFLQKLWRFILGIFRR
ncbi:MAG: D-alanyl-D-alanine carboxypeptidase [Clostridia bacterium]|nr:D-alanyl-D-alanine carboxypeptidase [Clostridia bacterium]